MPDNLRSQLEQPVDSAPAHSENRSVSKPLAWFRVDAKIYGSSCYVIVEVFDEGNGGRIVFLVDLCGLVAKNS